MDGKRRHKWVLPSLALILWGVLWLGLPGPAAGDVYVAGFSSNGANYDFFTLKYEPDGHRRWWRRYNSPFDAYDTATALKVDAAGNVYIAGYSGNGSNNDFCTVKYDADGRRLWARRYNSPFNGHDMPTALAVDGAGNVLVTGNSFNGDNLDYLTVKYNASGQRLWARRYNNGLGDDRLGNDNPAGVAVDAAGNVYVTGSSYSSAFTWDYVTIKYDADGNWQWLRRYNGPVGGDDFAAALVVDAAGNVHVTGRSFGGLNSDFLTIKYDTNGSRLWAQRVNGFPTPLCYDEPAALAVDPAGNVYVAGRSFNGYNDDFLTVKYDPDGNQLWLRNYNGPDNGHDQPKALAVDTAGNVYVAGASADNANVGVARDEYLTVKYNANGRRLWVRRYAYGDGGHDRPVALGVDAAGNAYVTGTSYNGIDNDYLTLKYAPDGRRLWLRRYAGTGNDQPAGLAVD